MPRFIIACALALFFSGILAAQETSSTNKQSSARAVADRYDKESDTWRLSLVRFVLKGELEKLREVETAMKQFTAAASSYIVYKRPGFETAQQLYYRNLENINRLDQLRQLVEMSHRDFPGYTKDFFVKYSVTIEDFRDFDMFEKIHEKIMNRWRAEFEAAMQKKSVAELKVIREDMKLLQQAVSAFVLLPGQSANKVPQLQDFENELRHGIVMLRMYEETMPAAGGGTR